MRVAAIVSMLALGCATAPPAATPGGSANTPGTDDPIAAGKRWRALTRAKKSNEARALCTPWLTASSKPLAVEGHKCLAQVELIELQHLRRGEVALEYVRVLEKRTPLDHRVVGAVGTSLIALKRDEEGLPYLGRAVELAPDDAIDTWNLGRFHEKHGNPTSAEPLYRRAVSLEKDPARRQDMACNLARFLAAQPSTRAEGCTEAAKQCGRPVPGCR